MTSASVSSDGLQIVAATASGSLGTLDIPSHAYRTLLRSHNATVHGVAADPQNDEVRVYVCVCLALCPSLSLCFSLLPTLMYCMRVKNKKKQKKRTSTGRVHTRRVHM